MNVNSWFVFSLRVWSTHCVNMRAISFSFILRCKVHLAEMAKFCFQKWLRTTHSREPSALWKGIFALLWNYDFFRQWGMKFSLQYFWLLMCTSGFSDKTDRTRRNTCWSEFMFFIFPRECPGCLVNTQRSTVISV